MTRKARIAVAVSGGGRSLANFLARQKTGAHAFEVVAVIASREDCGGVAIAREHGLPLFVEAFTAARLAEVGDRMYGWLAGLKVDYVALAGFLKLFPLDPKWSHRIVNIHPALLPKHGGKGMYGDRVHDAVIKAGDNVSGATVHFVDERYDEGAALAQITVPVKPGDDAHALAARVFAAECELYPWALDQLVAGKLPRPDGQVARLTHGAG